jgi:hypothetical protein
MSCNYCENFDPNDNDNVKEGWYGRPDGGQYELNQFVGSSQGPNAGPKSVGGQLYFDEYENDVNPTPTPSTEGWYNMVGGGQYEMNNHVIGNGGLGWGPRNAIQNCINLLLNPLLLLIVFIFFQKLIISYKLIQLKLTIA